MLKNLIMTMRTSLKILVLTVLATLIIICLFAVFYKPIYSVSINGEFIGYSGDKSKLQVKINDYMENGDSDNENVAFVQIDEMPEYTLCLLKKGITTSDEEIFNKVKELGTVYYRYYSVLVDGEEKIYVGTFENAEEVVNKLKEKDSNNIEKISITEIYNTELKDFTEIETAVNDLYEKKPVVVVAKTQTTTKTTTTTTTKSSGYSSSSIYAKSMSNQKVALGINIIRPISGTLTSRFGSVSSVRSGAHKGLDIAAPKGTAIMAAASGTVTCASYQGSYGNLVIISHGNGVETVYGHCSAIYVSVGQSVSQGQKIAAVGSTGNSTGPHLHLEIRVNGVAYNPQNYVY
ncbi:MAG: M23 family metallopeptidase [Clostridia bacterium]|nr:M23 family metallopeptidase [Clostridia bacterium]